jgi:hypothetical protein
MCGLACSTNTGAPMQTAKVIAIRQNTKALLANIGLSRRLAGSS